MDWPTDLVRPPGGFVRPPEPPLPEEPTQVLWYSARVTRGGYGVYNRDGELLAENPSWSVLCDQLGWTSVAATGEQVVAGGDRRPVAPQTGSAQSGRATRLDPSSPTVPEPRAGCTPQRAEAGPASPVAAAVSRPPVGRTTLASGDVVDRRDRDYGHPITYYLYTVAGELVCMSHSWAWLCHVRGWATLPGLSPGMRIPAGFPNAYDTPDEAADHAAIAAWDPKTSPAQTSVAVTGVGRVLGSASTQGRPEPATKLTPTAPVAVADPQIGLFG